MANRRRRSDQAPQRDQAEDRAPQNDQQDQRTRAITREDIERRAYDLYQQRGGGDGNDLEDWLQAEKDLGVR